MIDLIYMKSTITRTPISDRFPSNALFYRRETIERVHEQPRIFPQNRRVINFARRGLVEENPMSFRTLTLGKWVKIAGPGILLVYPVRHQYGARQRLPTYMPRSARRERTRAIDRYYHFLSPSFSLLLYISLFLSVLTSYNSLSLPSLLFSVCFSLFLQGPVYFVSLLDACQARA